MSYVSILHTVVQLQNVRYTYESFPFHGDLYFCHHVIIVSKPLQSAIFLDVERCCCAGRDVTRVGMATWVSRAGELALESSLRFLL